MTDELISSPQLLKLYQSQLIMLLTSTRARALHFCSLPTRQHTHYPTHTEASFFSTPNPTSKKMSPVAFVLKCRCCLSLSPLFTTPHSWRCVVGPLASHGGADDLYRPSSRLFVSTVVVTVGETGLGFGRPKSCAGRMLKPTAI